MSGKDILLIIVSVICGFLLCLLTTRKEVVDVKVSATVEDSTLERIIDDHLPDFVPVHAGSLIAWTPIDTTTPLYQLPIRQYEALDSFRITVGGKSWYPKFRLVFEYQGLAKRYWLTPMESTTAIVAQATIPKTGRDFGFNVFANILVNQSFELEESSIDARLFYKRVGIVGRAGIHPYQDEISGRTKLEPQIFFGACFKIL